MPESPAFTRMPRIFMYDEGSLIAPRRGINFIGPGTVVTDDAANDRVNVSITASTLDDNTDVTIASPSSGQTLVYNGSAWVNAFPATVASTGAINISSNTDNSGVGDIVFGTSTAERLRITGTGTIDALAPIGVTLATGTAALSTKVIGDTQPRILVRSQGLVEWGTGALAGDVSLERIGVGVLRVNGQANFTHGLATAVTAGIPSDAAMKVAADGGLAVDGTNHALYFRSGGTWRTTGIVAEANILAGGGGDILTRPWTFQNGITVQDGGIVMPDGTIATTAADLISSGGMTSNLDLTYNADSDNNGTGVINFQTAGITRARLHNNGQFQIGSSTTATVHDVKLYTYNGMNSLGTATTHASAMINGAFSGSIAPHASEQWRILSLGAYVSPSVAGLTFPTVYGLYNEAGISTAHAVDVTSMYVYRAAMVASGLGGTIGTAYGFYVNAYMGVTGNKGSITRAEGLRVENMAIEGINHGYGIVVANQTGPGGGIHAAIAISGGDTANLWLNSNTASAAGGIAFGTTRDVNLYRAAALELRTDAHFSIERSGGAGSGALQTLVTGDTTARYYVRADGQTSWGPGNAARDAFLERWFANTLLINGTALYSIRAATSNTAFGMRISGESNDRLTIRADGLLAWGSGSAATDVTLYRVNSVQLGITGAIRLERTAGLTALDALVTGDTNARFNMTATGVMSWGPGNAALDITLSRLDPALLLLTAGIRSMPVATTNSSYQTIVSGDTTPRFVIRGSGAHEWGSGNAAADITMSRIAAQVLGINEAQLRFTTAANRTVLETIITGDTQIRFHMLTDGEHRWGPGNATYDLRLWRFNDRMFQTTGGLRVNPPLATDNILTGHITGDTSLRFTVQAGGLLGWGPGNAATDVILSRDGASTLTLSAGYFRVLQASNSYAFAALATGDTQPRFLVRTNGRIEFGPGNATIDTVIRRTTAGLVQIGDGSLNGRLQVVTTGGTSIALESLVTGDTVGRVQLLGNGTVQWGPGNAAADTMLERVGVSQLQLFGRLSFRNTTGTAVAASSLATGDTHSRWFMDASGAMTWGPGNAAQDTTMARVGAGVLEIGNNTSSQLVQMRSSLSANWVLSTVASGDTNQRFVITANGNHSWGSGSAAQDTTLARTAARSMSGNFELLLSRQFNTEAIIRGRQDADTFDRYALTAHGLMSWGEGAANPDLTMQRLSVGGNASLHLDNAAASTSVVGSGTGFALAGHYNAGGLFTNIGYVAAVIRGERATTTTTSQQSRFGVDVNNAGTLTRVFELRADAEIAADETAVILRRNLAGVFTSQRVSMGAADSAGAGFRQLRVPN